ncbi:hypothetical protein [Pseudonocardia sp. ICBG162]|uniref:hypothetical protein n=1 Tax=Pseudonocardia sp. ICBG162 TaxID=2846761 RepID=UPI001CF68F54|nr:hypothetical protein [Pseudonocardia sp. ICBG162]
MTDARAESVVAPLAATPVGPHVLIADGTEASRERGFLSSLGSSGPPVAMLVGTAYRRPGLAAELLRLLHEVVTGPAGADGELWLAVTDIAALGARLQQVADATGVALVAPSGAMRFSVGSGILTGPTVGGTGWVRFAPGSAPQAHGTRFPRPDWEGALPDEPAAVGGAAVEPVPAGLAVRGLPAPEAGTENDDVALRAVLDRRFVQLLVGGTGPVPTPEAIAGAARTITSGCPVLVAPLTPAALVDGFPAALGEAIGADFALGTGVALRTASGVETFVVEPGRETRMRPFPTVLRQRPDGGQDVLSVGLPPAGWDARGCSYVRDDVVATVVPSGLVLGAGDAGPVPPDPYDPAVWTLHLGHDGEPVGAALLAAARSLVDSLDDERRARHRVRLRGVWATPEDAERAVSLGLLPRPAPASWDTTVPDLRVESAVPAAPVPAVAEPPTPGEHPAVDPAPEPGGPADGPTGGAVPAPDADVTPPGPAADAGPVGPVTGDHGPGDTDPAATTGATDARPPLVVDDRPSTGRERERFVAAAGDLYTEALATVNAALASWPSLRTGDTSGVKTDLAAVCLHLGDGERGGGPVNEGVRSGGRDLPEGQLACLVSGLRRLPTHRRPVLRQGRAPEPPSDHIVVGGTLAEPGFLSAAGELDVTVPDAGYDVLIWPMTARRTSELVAGRPVAEVVFPAGTRFRTIGVRDAPAPEDIDGGPVAPRLALLVRELGADEGEGSGGLGERDQAALARLERALERRRRMVLRTVEDPDVVRRLTVPLLTVDAGATGDSAAAS